jgi:MurNAc alpha-1-phosphate uridylyltransferase
VPLQVVILAGGRGTRMRPFTDDVPKALVPVAGQPFVHRQLALLAREGVREVILSIGYRGEMIRTSVGEGDGFGLRVRYVDEGTGLRGTAGALRLCLERAALDQSFMVLYGDSYLPIALAPVAAAFNDAGRPALMTVLRNDGRWDRSNVIFEEGDLQLYDKRRTDPRMHHIDYGLSVLSRSVIERVPAGAPADLADLYHDLSRAGELAGHEVARRFYEIGSPEGLRDLEAFVLEQSGVGGGKSP